MNRMLKTSFRASGIAVFISLCGCTSVPKTAPLQNGAGGTDSIGTGGMTATGTGGMAPSGSGGAAPSGTGGEVPVSTGGMGVVSTDGTVDPTGVWWAEVETIGSEVLPILDKLTDVDIRFVMRVEVSGTAPEHSVKFEFCDLQTEWIDPADPNNITTIGFRPDTVAAFTETITQDLGGLSVGSEVPLPKLTFRGGIDEAGESFDDDNDGNPAVTAWVRTLLGIEIEVYEEITIHATLDLTAPDENTLQGTVDFNAEADVLTSNNPIIFAGSYVTITPDSTAVPVTVRRLDGGGDCSTIPSTVGFTAVPPRPVQLIPPPEPLPAP